MIRYHDKYDSRQPLFWMSHMVNSSDSVNFTSLFTRSGKTGGLQISAFHGICDPRCQGFAVVHYSCTLGRLGSAASSTFATLGGYTDKNTSRPAFKEMMGLARALKRPMFYPRYSFIRILTTSKPSKAGKKSVLTRTR